MPSHYDNPFISGVQIAEAPVMWEPEVFDDVFVNPDGIRKDGTRGQTIEPHTEETRNEAWYKSLPKDPGGNVIWDMVPTDFQYLKDFEPAPRPYKIPVIPFEEQPVSSNDFLNNYEIADTSSYPKDNWNKDDADLLKFLQGGGLGIQEKAIDDLIRRRGSA